MSSKVEKHREQKKYIGLRYVQWQKKRIKGRELDSDQHEEYLKNNSFELIYFRWNSGYSRLIRIFMLQLCWDRDGNGNGCDM